MRERLNENENARYKSLAVSTLFMLNYSNIPVVAFNSGNFFSSRMTLFSFSKHICEFAISNIAVTLPKG